MARLMYQSAIMALMAYNAHPGHIKVVGEVARATSAAGLLDAFGMAS